ncbi:MAG: hypothetical protein ACKVWV_08445 [Planctomycetota bacterium]
MNDSIRSKRFFFVVLAAVAAHVPCSAQCLDAASGFQAPGVVRGELSTMPSTDFARALAVYDDGSGPALYCAGRFTQAAGVDAVNIARFDGAGFAPLGSGLCVSLSAPGNGDVRALAVYDDGTGPALFAGGTFLFAGGSPASFVAKWNGAAWSPLGAGVNGEVRALCVYDDGSGDALYVTGNFTTAGGSAASHLAKWDGASWSALGTGLNAPGNALAVFDDGTATALYVGGGFTIAGGVSAQCVVRFDGSAWQALAAGLNTEVFAFSVFDDGTGSALYAGGAFTHSGGLPAFRVARWNGAAWSAVGASGGGGTNGNVYALRVHGVGTARALYAGGLFSMAENVAASNIARWKDGAWSAVGDGFNGTVNVSDSFDRGVRALGSFDSGSGSELYAGGRFDASEAAALNNIARFDGAAWRPLGAGHGVMRDIVDLAVYDDGSGPALYAAGFIRTAGMLAVADIARFDGTRWAAVGDDIGVARSLAVHDFGAGEVLVAARSNSVRTWDGATWSVLGSTFNNQVNAVVVHDDGTGPALYTGGDFSNGGMQHVARWNGASWEPLGGGVNGRVSEMVSFNDGSGPLLVVAGEFTHAGALPASGVARWDGSQWSALANGIGGFPVRSLAVFDHGSGAQLYGAAAIGFGGPVGRVARWIGTSWVTIGETTISSWINDLFVFGDGTPDGVALYAGGQFTSIDGVPASHLARYDGSSWSAVGAGTDGAVIALCAWNDGSDSAAELFVAGDFAHVDGVASIGIGALRGCPGPGVAYCFVDGTLAVPCPCAPPDLVPVPSGSPFAGCASVTNPHGASFAASGTTNPDTLELVASGVTPGGTGMFFKGDAQIASGLAIADGVRCVGGSFVRFGLQAAVSGVSRYPNVPLGYTLPVSVVGATPPGSGLTGYYQFVYRSAQLGFCGPGTLNFTNAYRQQW